MYSAVVLCDWLCFVSVIMWCWLFYRTLNIEFVFFSFFLLWMTHSIGNSALFWILQLFYVISYALYRNYWIQVELLICSTSNTRWQLCLHEAFLLFVGSRLEHILIYNFCVCYHQAGLALGDLKSVKDLYDFKTLSILFLIGLVAIIPTLLKRKRVYE